MNAVKGIVVVLLVLGIVAPCWGLTETVTWEGKLVAGNSQFAFDLYAKLKDAPGNLFFSPYSMSTALAMTYAGARGETAKEMARTLHFELPAGKLHPAFAALMRIQNPAGKEGSYQLSVVNALWGQKGYGFLDGFLALAQTHYGAGLRQVDFVGATEKARQTINQWAEKQTQEKIKDLIPKGVLNKLTRLVLTNAIYFKGAWIHQFKKASTKDEPFRLSPEKKVNVAMMSQTEKFRYMEGKDFQAVELGYRGRGVSMVVFLPKKVDGLAAFEKSLSADNVSKWLAQLRRRRVALWLPKFKTTSSFRMKKVLSEMGMPAAFGGAADFSGMNGKKDLYIAAVIHKAFVDVNEEGTEAAAATAVVMALKSAFRPEKPVVFRADHPFLFLIRDRRSGSILFIGRVVNPLESGGE